MQKLAAYKKIWIGIGIVLLIVLPLVCSLPRDKDYKNKIIGYELTVPAGWDFDVSVDKRTVTLTKEFRHRRRAEITIQADLGNPYGQTGFDYVYYGLSPRLEYKHPGSFVRLQDASYNRRLNDLEWGVIAYSLDYEEYYRIYAAVFNEYVVTLTLKTPESNREEAEKDFQNIVNSFAVERKERVNVFTDQQANSLFEHPL